MLKFNSILVIKCIQLGRSAVDPFTEFITQTKIKRYIPYYISITTLQIYH